MAFELDQAEPMSARRLTLVSRFFGTLVCVATAAAGAACRSDDESGPRFEVYVANMDGSGSVRLFEGLAPSWTPDGTQIAFARMLDGRAQLFVADADGSDERPLTTSQANDARPRPSPDGSRYLFWSDRSGTYQLYLVNADGSGLRALTSGFSENRNAAWSPDGKHIAYSSQNLYESFDLMVMEVETGRIRQLTDSPFDELLPEWSPDGTRIAYTKGPSCLVPSPQKPCADDIYTMNVDGSDQRQLTRDGRSRFPAWTPDGRILFTNRGAVYIMDADGLNSRQLVPGENYLPSASPDGARLLYVHAEHPKTGWNPLR